MSSRSLSKQPRAIAIGDNHPLFRLAIAEVMRGLHPDCSVREVGGFEPLMELLAAESYDLIVADLGMPGCSWLALDNLISAANGAPVVAFASRADADQARALLERGVRGYIPKASSPATVRGALRRILAGDSFLPAEMEKPPTPFGQGTLRMSPRQEQVLMAISKGRSVAHIANDLGISEATVKLHLRGAIRAMGAKNRTMAVLTAERRGLFRETAQ